jgi:adenosine deaminase
VWVEAHVHPPVFGGRFGSDTETLDLVLEAASDAARHAAIGVGLVVSVDREGDPADAVALAGLAADRSGAGVVAFGLAGNENGFPPEPFSEAFLVAREAGLLSVPHAGEMLGASSVRAALDQLGARRIAHGVRAAEDPLLVERLAADGVCLDVCPTSNVALGVVPALDLHPLPELLEAGVPISLNGDDPFFFGASLLDEYETCRDAFAFDDVAMAELARASIESSGAPEGTRREAIERLVGWLRSPPNPI